MNKERKSDGRIAYITENNWQLREAIKMTENRLMQINTYSCCESFQS